MKRRQAIQTILSLPALTALPAAAQEKAAPTVDEHPRLDLTNAEAVADPAHNFFTPEQFQTLQRLCEILVPPSKDAGVAEFLDFLIAQSPKPRQTMYRRGLDRLGASPGETAALLAVLREPWTYQGPVDEFAQFLAAVKEDTLRATINSRQWAAASTGRRGGSGIGTYWYALD
jgi:hypothetical protein